MRIMLADDEKLVRLGLKNMLEELYPDKHEYLEAGNGEQTLELIDRTEPDIIFLDIHMPKKNGLDVFKQICSRSIAVIMLTGYAEFEYARQALSYGAIEYLLKPASLNEVDSAFQKALAVCQDNVQKQQNNYQLEFIKIMDLYQSIDYAMSPKSVVPPYHLLMFYPDSPGDTTRLLHHFEQLPQLPLFSSRHRLYATHILTSGEFCILCNFTPDKEQKKQLLPGHLSAFLVAAETLPELLSGIRQIQHLSSIRICQSYGCLFSADTITAGHNLLTLSRRLEEIGISYKADSLPAYQKLIDKLRSDSACRELYRLADFFSIQSYVSAITGCILTPGDFDMLLNQLLSFRQDDTQSDIISAIRTYVEKNYMNQIGISTIAELLNLSPNYLSKVFKQRTGSNFIDYLTSIRIEKAIELFQEQPQITVKAVAEQVGYFSNRYFTKLFLKHTSCLPSEYQKSIKYHSICRLR